MAKNIFGARVGQFTLDKREMKNKQTKKRLACITCMMLDLRGFHKKNDPKPANHNYGLKIKTDGSWDSFKPVQPDNFSKFISLSVLVCH